MSVRNFIFAAAAAATLASSPALAQQGQVSVDYSQLNLSSEAGVAALDERIERAVERLCHQPGPLFIEISNGEVACRAAAMRSVAEQRAAAIGRLAGRSTASAIRAAR